MALTKVYNRMLGDSHAQLILTTATGNIGIGANAVDSITTGDYNVGLGDNALTAVTTGSRNTAVGYEASAANTTGGENVGVGRLALTTNTTGSNNVALGVSALRYSTTADNNTAVGYSTLMANTTGANNTAFGYQSLYSNTTGASNTVTGWKALYNNTTGTENVAHGQGALYSITTASGNIAVGTSSLYDSTTGSSNTAIGHKSLRFNTTGAKNTATGYQSLYSNTAGYENVATGFESLWNVTTGYTNNAYGYQSLRSTSSGHRNAAFGGQALYSNTSAAYNCAFGHKSLYANTTGANNTAIGFESLYVNTTANKNTALGNTALRQNSTGANNTSVGQDSGYYNTTGSNNVYVGKNAGQNITTGSYNIVIGAGSIDAPSATLDNQLNIGNTIYGDIGNGNIGIGGPPATDWSSIMDAIQFGNRGVLYSYNNLNTGLGANHKYIGSGWKYLESAYATQYLQTSAGEHQFNCAISGTAGNTVYFGATAMTIKNDKGVLINGKSTYRTAPVTGGGILDIRDTGEEGGAGPTGNHGGGLVFGCKGGSVDGYFCGMKGGLGHGGSNTAGHLKFYTRNAHTDSYLSERMRIEYDGTVLINTPNSASSQYPLQMVFNNAASTLNRGMWIEDTTSATSSFGVYFRKGSTNVGNIILNTSSVSYNTTSDYRLKENLVPLTDSIERVKALNVYRFNFIAEPDVTVDGFMAHEAGEIVPEAVSGEKDAMRIEEWEVTPRVEEVWDNEGNITAEAVDAVMDEREVMDPQGIDQAKLVPLLTAAIQELAAKVESLEAQLNNT